MKDTSAGAEAATGIDHEALWGHLRRLLAELGRAVDRGAFLDDCLDLLVDMLGANRGLILLFHPDGDTQVINARGKGKSLDPFEREEMSRTIVARVRRVGESVLCRPLEEAQPTESVHRLGIFAAIVAPLPGLVWRAPSDAGTAGEARESSTVRGALYLDFRDRRRRVGAAQLELVEAAASIMAAVLEPYQKLQVVKEDVRTLRARARPPGPTLDELLRPESMGHIRREVLASLGGNSSILVLGESGTGKTELARAMAEASGRTPVVRAMLGMADDLNTVRSELFGHERGSFTGAVQPRTGVVELADKGTLIFDEILNLSPGAQQLLLDFTQYGTYRPLGSKVEKRADVRLVAVTNGDMEQAIREGRFRSDLYYRLAQMTLVLPPLRERRQDIPGLAEGVLRRIDRGRQWRLSAELRRALIAEDLTWAGNFRQLETAIARGRDRALLDDPDVAELTPRHVDLRNLASPQPPAPAHRSEPLPAPRSEDRGDLGATWTRLQEERARLDQLERELLTAALAKHRNVVAHAAREIGVARTSMLSRLDTLGLPRSPRKPGR